MELGTQWSIKILFFFFCLWCAELSGVPYVLSSDLLQCEVTLVGTDYKNIIYQQLDIYNPGKEWLSRLQT